MIFIKNGESFNHINGWTDIQAREAIIPSWIAGSVCQGIQQKLEPQSGKLVDWVRELLCRKSNFVVTCALENKLARIAKALTTRQQIYEA